MNIIKKCAATALCLTVLGSTAAALNNVTTAAPIVNTTMAQAAENAKPYKAFEYNGGYYVVGEDGGCAFVEIKDAEVRSFTVPARAYDSNTKKWYKVTELGDARGIYNLPARFGKLETITVSGSYVKKINKNSFRDCTYLQHLVWASSTGLSNLEEIGDYAFSGARLQDFDFLKCTKLKRIGAGAFRRAELHKIDLRNTVLTEIASLAFSENTHFSGVVYYPGTLEELGDCAFSKCPYITEFRRPNLTDTGLLWKIGYLVFNDCPQFKRFRLPDSERSAEFSYYSRDYLGAMSASKNHIVTVTVDWQASGRSKAVKLHNADDVAAYKNGYLKFERSGAYTRKGTINIYDATGSKSVLIGTVK